MKLTFTVRNGMRIVVADDADSRNTMMFNKVLSSTEVVAFSKQD